MLTFVLRLVLAILGLVFFLVGVVMTIAPTPFGFVIVIIGFLMLAAAAPMVIRRARRRWLWADRQLRKIAARGPAWLARILSKTDPNDAMANETAAPASEEDAAAQ